jgi:hypothetical protein
MRPFFIFTTLAVVDLVLVAAAILFYRGDFLFWPYPLSYAGMKFTLDGVGNSPATYIYSLAMLLSALIMLLAYRYYTKERDKISTILSLFASLGFLIAAFSPDDIRHTFHVIGSSMFVASLWLIATIHIARLKSRLSRQQYYTLMGFLQIPVFAYAITYFAFLDAISAPLQKFAFLGLFTVLILVSYINKPLEAK